MVIRGTIKDKQTGEALPSANIFISGADGKYVAGSPGTYTDPYGKYMFNAEGNYLTATYTGYQSKTLPVSDTVNFDLTRGVGLPEVQITGFALWPRVLAIIITIIVFIWLLKPFHK